MPIFSLLLLSACGGGSKTGASLDSGGSFDVNGFAIKGPIDGAVAFIDVNDDGLLQDDEPFAYTEADGSFTIDNDDGASGDLIVTTDSAVVAPAGLSISAVDTSSSTSLSNVTLSAPSGATVVSPTSTLINESTLSEAQVKEALGLTDVDNLLTFNPYADGVDASLALDVEKAATQVMTTVKAVAAVAESAGGDAAASISAATATTSATTSASAA